MLVTDPKARVVSPQHELSVPRTADEFARRFASSDIARANRVEMSDYQESVSRPEHTIAFKQRVEEERGPHAFNGPYSITTMAQARIVIKRRLQILKGDYKLQAIQLMYALFFASFFFYADPWFAVSL